VPSIASDKLSSSPLQSAIGPAALPEEFGPQEVARDARMLSAKEPVEQAPSVIAEPPVTVAAYALGIIICPGGAIIGTTANAAAIRVAVRIIFVLICKVFFIVQCTKNYIKCVLIVNYMCL
jgi:hypothetical protein